MRAAGAGPPALESTTMLALVTGATGFVGANLVDALGRRGWRARALRRERSSLAALHGLAYETALGDVTEPGALGLAMAGVDIVFHVAAVADYWRPGALERMLKVNVDGTRNVLEAASRAGVRRVVFTSSCASLGQPDFGVPADETHAFSLSPGEFAYGHSKVLAERVAAEYVARGLDVVTVNPAVVLGPRDVNLISGSLVIQAARGVIPFVPPGGVCMIDVEDCCDAHIAAAERGRAGERYILGGDNLWYRDVLRTVCAEVGGRFVNVTPPRRLVRALARPVAFARDRLRLRLPVDADQVRFSAETFWFDASKARRELGLRTRPFVETVRRTRDWYRANGYL